ncbi:hypothetical protein CMK11_10465 [Candidatus Poribacteria bacterium]|nr:hypothetical protein [Candidatus Poribacteria bacterium]
MRVSDEALIAGYLRGDASALAVLWTRYDGFVYGIARSVTRRHEVAEDIRQEVFITLMGRIDTLECHAKFAAWLRTVTYNACKTWLRGRRPGMPLDDLDERHVPRADPAAGALENGETHTALRRAVDRLDLDHRQVVELYYYEGYSVAKVAEMLDIAETTVKWRLHKARESLRRLQSLYT